MNLLELVQEFCTRTGIPSPISLAGSTNQQVLQICSLVRETLEQIRERFPFEQSVEECVFVSVAGEDQGDLEDLAPGMQYILNETLYDRTRNLPLFGPKSPSEWQKIKALPTTGPFYRYRIVRGHLLIDPEMPAGHQIAFEYVTLSTAYDADGVAKAYPRLETDTFRYPDYIVLAGLRWIWKKEKGLEYGEEFRAFEELVGNAAGRSGTKATVFLDDCGHTAKPGIIVPDGNWMQS